MEEARRPSEQTGVKGTRVARPALDTARLPDGRGCSWGQRTRTPRRPICLCRAVLAVLAQRQLLHHLPPGAWQGQPRPSSATRWPPGPPTAPTHTPGHWPAWPAHCNRPGLGRLPPATPKFTLEGDANGRRMKQNPRTPRREPQAYPGPSSLSASCPGPPRCPPSGIPGTHFQCEAACLKVRFSRHG